MAIPATYSHLNNRAHINSPSNGTADLDEDAFSENGHDNEKDAHVSDEDIVKALETYGANVFIAIVPMAMSLAQETGWNEVRNVFVQAYSTIGIMAVLMLSLVSGLLEVEEGSESMKKAYGILISTSFVLIFTGTVFCMHLLIHLSLWTSKEMLKFLQVWNQLVLAPVLSLFVGIAAFGVAFCFRMYVHYSSAVWITSCALACCAGLFLGYAFVKSSYHLRRQRLFKFMRIANRMKRTDAEGYRRLINS